MIIAPRIVALALTIFSLTSTSPFAQTRRGGGSAQSHARALKVLEAGIAALGGLEAIRETQVVSLKITGFSYARNRASTSIPRLTR